MNQTKQTAQKASFLLMQFLIDFSYYLFLFSFTFFLILKFQSLELIAAAMIFFGFSKMTVGFVSKNFIISKQPRTYFILGFALQFLAIIFLNKTLTVITTLLAILFWAYAVSFIKFASNILIQKNKEEIIGNWEYLHRPVKMASLLLTPAFGTYLIFQTNPNDVISYLGVIASLTAIIYLIGFNNISRKRVALPNLKLQINKTTIVTGFLTAYFWIFAPVTMYLEKGEFNEIAWILVWFSIPYVLILVWKNIFKRKIWQLRPIMKSFLLVAFLIPFGFGLYGIAFKLAVLLLGIVLALIQSSDAQEGNFNNNYSMHQINFGAGFILAMLIGFIAVNRADFGLGLIALAVVISTWVIYAKLRKYIKRRIF